jgi:hypothetical protein
MPTHRISGKIPASSGPRAAPLGTADSQRGMSASPTTKTYVFIRQVPFRP